MTDWEQIIGEAQPLAVAFQAQLRNEQANDRDAGFNEAQKALNYYLSHHYDESAFNAYLNALVERTPARTRRSLPYYRAIRTLWRSWQTALTGQDKARAWGWAIRLAKTAHNTGGQPP